jgi:hypothetical protein
MHSKSTYGWKTYLVAALSIGAGMVALGNGYVGDGLKGIIGGLALAALRDAMGKIQQSIDSNRRVVRDMRAAIETTSSPNQTGNR